MKYIHITKSFQKHLKRLKKYLNENDIIDDVENFIKVGTKKGESLLKEEVGINGVLKYYKLRISVRMVDFRYILSVVEDVNGIGVDYIPNVIDLKKGRYGGNLGFESDNDTKKFVNNGVDISMADYMDNSEENETATTYAVNI